MDDLPRVPILACRYNGNLLDQFVVTVECPYTEKLTYHIVEGIKGEELFERVNTHTKGRDRVLTQGYEKGYYIEGTLNEFDLPHITKTKLPNTRLTPWR